VTAPLSQSDLAKLLTVYERLAALGRQARLAKGEKHVETITDSPLALDKIYQDGYEPDMVKIKSSIEV
jgi:hypothetical protein